jgi:hypothetical protein
MRSTIIVFSKRQNNSCVIQFNARAAAASRFNELSGSEAAGSNRSTWPRTPSTALGSSRSSAVAGSRSNVQGMP